MDGVNHRVRNTPVNSSTTKDHSAISPSMNDQWSGKTLRRFLRTTVASPNRSSAQVATPLVRLGGRVTAGRPAFVLATPRSGFRSIPPPSCTVLVRQFVQLGLNNM